VPGAGTSNAGGRAGSGGGGIVITTGGTTAIPQQPGAAGSPAEGLVANDSSESSGCGCRLARGERNTLPPLFGVASLVLAGLHRRRAKIRPAPA
jgi:MYXO-CTERM domain-containing protein